MVLQFIFRGAYHIGPSEGAQYTTEFSSQQRKNLSKNLLLGSQLVFRMTNNSLRQCFVLTRVCLEQLQPRGSTEDMYEPRNGSPQFGSIA